MLYVNMTELSNAQIAGNTLFLGVYVRVIIWIGELSKANGPSQYGRASPN